MLIATDKFDAACRTMARIGGIPEIRWAVVPHPLGSATDEELLDRAHSAVEQFERIIGSFQGIGRSGSASLAIVAPGIAEALIATAVGLFAAIPATIFYNSFLTRIDQLSQAIDLFRADFEDDLDHLAAEATGASLPRRD